MGEVAMRSTARPYDAVMAFTHDGVVQRYAIDHGVPVDVARRRFDAFKQFMLVCAAKPGPKVTSTVIDGVWHSFLLFTKDYRAFCEQYLGRFINHEPFETPQPGVYVETRRFAQGLFGELNEEMWPLQGGADCSSGCDD
jgi:hypothetical protein